MLPEKLSCSKGARHCHGTFDMAVLLFLMSTEYGVAENIMWQGTRIIFQGPGVASIDISYDCP